MQKRTIFILVLVTLALVGILFAQDIATQWTQSGLEKKSFVPSLKKQLGSVAKVVITVGGNKDFSQIHLVKSEDVWRVQEKENVVADNKKISQFLIRLGDATPIEPKTTRAEYYEKIGVQEPNVKGGVRVDLVDQSEKPITSIFIGRYAGPQSGTYVRKLGESQSWLVSGNLTPETQVGGWLDKEIINLSPDAIQKITIQIPKKPGLVLTKNKREDIHFQLEGMGKETLVEQNKIDELGGALRYVQFVEVRKAQDPDFEVQKTTNIEYRLFDGLVLKARLAVVNNQNLFAMEAIQDPVQEKLFASTHANQTKKDEIAGLTLPKNGGYHADTLRAKVEGWTYTLPSYKANSMVNTLDQLVKKHTKAKS